jgi:NTE family protein
MIINRWRDFFSTRRIEQAFRSALGQEAEDPHEDEPDNLKVPNIFRVCAQSVAIMENVINDLQMRQNPHDLIIRPPLNAITLLEFHRAKEVIAAGEAATRIALPEIRHLLKTA